MTQNNYNQTALIFAKKHNIKLKILNEEWGRKFDDDKHDRAIFKCKLIRNNKSYTFTFGQSIAAGSEHPKMYNILACLTKYDPGTFDNFCGEFDYSNDSIKAHKTYKQVTKEWEAVNRLFGDIINELTEIN